MLVSTTVQHAKICELSIGTEFQVVNFLEPLAETSLIVSIGVTEWPLPA